MKTRRFQRRTEDFVCEKCSTPVMGRGYTNHCPRCLWSKHVDVNPGDRAQRCLGLMEPIRIEVVGGQYRIVHRCLKCNETRNNRADENDNFDAVLAIARNHGQGGRYVDHRRAHS